MPGSGHSSPRAARPQGRIAYDGGMAEPDAPARRDETPTERADRNWSELTQELRVTQTGTQILTAFLLTLPFQPRFAELPPVEVALYLALVVLGVLTTALMVAPVSLHRFLFGRGRKIELVRIASRITAVALVALALLITGTVAFVFGLVLGGAATWIAPLIAILVLGALWLVLPWRMSRSGRE